MTGETPRSDSGPGEGLGPAHTIGELRRLLERFEGDAQRDGTPRALAEAFQVNSRILQYVHDAHVRLLETVEKSDRSEMVIQSADALNRTFQKLHDAQERLSRRLEREERAKPRRMALFGALTGAVLVAAVFVVADAMRSGVDGLAQAQDRLDGSYGNFRDASEALLDTVDRGFAANRVLANENRAHVLEIDRLGQRVGALETEREESASRLAAVETDLRSEKVRNVRLESDLAKAREELVERDLKDEKIVSLLENAAVPIDTAGTVLETAAAPEPAAPEPVAGIATVQAVNRFLEDAGVIGLRLLQCGGIADGAIRDAVFELRETGFPIGCHAAARSRIAIDAATLRGTLILEDGSTTRHGARTPFADGVLRLDVAAVAPGSWQAPALAGAVTVTGTWPPPEPASAPAADTVEDDVIDLAPLVARINRAFKADGYGVYDLAALGAVGAGALRDVRLHHYEASGALQKTVVAARCSVQIDEERGVTLRFEEGSHVANGREVPFYRGRGEQEGSWTLELPRGDPARWRSLVDSFGEYEAEP